MGLPKNSHVVFCPKNLHNIIILNLFDSFIHFNTFSFMCLDLVLEHLHVSTLVSDV